MSLSEALTKSFEVGRFRSMPVRTLLNLITKGQARHHVPEGLRVYAVGDIHGRLDLLETILNKIDEDTSRREPADRLIIFLGDLVDRGPDSRGVVHRLIGLSRGPTATRFLIGNHEEVFLRAIEGDLSALRFLIRIGGRQTILSYGISEAEYHRLDLEELAGLLRQRVPPEHVAFLSSFERWIGLGDYIFVHAGLRPGIAIEDQSLSDLCWIRGDFLRHRGSFHKMVIHGHSITEDVDVRSNRIGIDTGAFASGRLTAIGLEKDKRWFLST